MKSKNSFIATDAYAKKRQIAFRVLLCLVCAFVVFSIVSSAFFFDSAIADAAVLKQGSRGDTVKTMQQKLIRWGYLKGTADGVFGAKTKSAVIGFQKKNGLTADNGWDPTYNCLFYYNPRTATSKWMLSRPVKLTIGNHAFC